MARKYKEVGVDKPLHVFKYTSIWDQLGKILDSADVADVVDPEKFTPFTTILTDDGKTYDVTADVAQQLRDVITGLPVVARREVLVKIQQSEGFELLLAKV